MTSEQDWGLTRRIGFRFGVVFGALLIYPFPLNVLPKTEKLTALLRQPRGWATQWFGQSVLGLPGLSSQFNGSGDRTFDYVQLLLFAILGAIGAIAWSALDRRRSHPRLAAAARVVLRYYVGYAMLSYGFAKILRQQFGDLTPYELHFAVRDVSPMGLLWRFMDYSAPYTVFGGLCEAVPGALLLWRRTATIGAVMVIAVMANVVMLNFSYDVAVKLYSTQLLVMAGLVVLPDARRLLAAALGRATPEAPVRVRMSPRRERVRQIARAAFLLALVAGLYMAARAADSSGRVHELQGEWVVDSFAVDGVERLLAADPMRWETLAASPHGMAIRLTSGDRDPPITADRGAYLWKVDEANHAITVTIDADKKLEEIWHYSHPASDRLVIDAVHLGKSLHVTLHAAPPSLLLTRGFHWINEQPFSQ